MPKNVKINLGFNFLYKGSIFIVDDNRLQQVLINLLSNAIKFSPENSTIDFKVDFSPSENSLAKSFKENFYEVKFRVIDKGIGIS